MRQAGDIFGLVAAMLDFAERDAHFRGPVARAAAIVLAAVDTDAIPASALPARSAPAKPKAPPRKRAPKRAPAKAIESIGPEPTILVHKPPVAPAPPDQMSGRYRQLLTMLQNAAPHPVGHHVLIKRVYPGMKQIAAEDQLRYDAEALRHVYGYPVSNLRGIGISLRAEAA